MDKNRAGQELAALRQRVASVCAICGAAMIRLPLARYCSNACRQRAKYQRLRDRQRQPRAQPEAPPL